MTGGDAGRMLGKGFIMNKKLFGEEIKRGLEDRFEGNLEIKLQEVKKNNGVMLLGIMVNDTEKNVAPTVYLDDLFRDWEGGRTMEDILDLLERSIRSGMPKKRIDMEFFTDYDVVKDKICYKLINGEKNRELLEEIPNIPFLDLAICFYYPFYHEEIGHGSILIRNDHLKSWGVTVTDVWKAAEHNTRLAYPQQCCPMEELLLEITGKKAKIWPALPEENEEGPFAMKILTNRQRVFGAAVILYDRYLEELADCLNGNFYLLPCSIHEMILLPEKENMEKRFLENMVRDSNEKVVEEQEYLSDHVYFFDRTRKRVEIVTP